MLRRICRKWTVHASSLFRTSDYVVLESNRRNIYRDIKTRPCLRIDRKLSSVSKVVFDSKSENSNKQPTDNNEEIAPLHDLELQKFLEEIQMDFDEQPAKKKPTGTEPQDDIVSKSDDTGTRSDTDAIQHYKLSAQEFTNLPLSIKEKFEQYKDEDSNIIRSAEETSQQLSSWKQQVIEVEEEEEVYLYQEKHDRLDYFSFERGKRGVFDIEQLVTILKQENTYDIAVIEIPPSLHYCDYMALATAKSPRHLVAVADFIRRLHKKKKLAGEPFLKIEGENCCDWKVIDMSHIVLHLFLPEARELYDIETLWTVGEKYDPLSNQKADPYEDLLEEHMEFLKNAEPLIDT